MSDEGPKKMPQPLAGFDRAGGNDTAASQPQADNAGPAGGSAGPPLPPTQVSERIWQAIDSSAICIVLVDRDGQVTYANRRARELLGLEASAGEPRTFNDPGWKITAVDGGEFPDEKLPFHIVKRTGRPVADVRHAIEMPDGRRVALSINAAPLWDGHGEFDGMAASLEDITDRLAMEDAIRQSEERFSRMLAIVPDMVSIHDPQMNILYSNWQGFAAVPEEKRVFGTKCHKTYREQDSICPDCRAKEVLQTGKPFQEEVQLPDGRWVDLRVMPIRGDDGQIEAFMEWVRDITERKRTQEEIRFERDRAEQYLDIVGVIMVALDTDGRVQLLNRRGCEVLGVRQEEAIGQPWFERFVPENDRPRAQRGFQSLISGQVKPAEHFENYVRTHTGERRLIVWHNACVRDADGRVIGTISSGRDVTESRRQQEALAESEQRFRTIFQKMTDGVILADPHTRRFHDANPAICRMTGYTREELLGLSAEDIHRPENLPAVKARFKRLAEGEDLPTHDIPVLRKDGTEFEADITTVSMKLGGRAYFAGFFHDVTERNQAARALQASEDRFTRAMEATRDGLFDWNLQTDEIYYSPGWKRMLGYEPHELPNDFSVWEKLTDPRDVERAWQMQQEVVSGRRDRFEIEFRMKHKAGRWVDILARAKALFDDDGTPSRMIGTHVDITDRKQAAEQLHQSMQTYSDLIAAIPSGLFIYQYKAPDSLKLVDGNPASAELTGVNPQENIGREFDDIWPAARQSGLTEKLLEVMRTGQRYTTEEFRYADDLLEGAFRIIAFAMPGKRLCVAFENVTERFEAEQQRRQLEEQLRQAQKMEAVGQLAGGVAHDFNNLLQAIAGYTHLAMPELPEGHSDVHSHLKEVKKASDRAAAVTKQLLTFSRRETLQPRHISLNEVIGDLSRMLNRVLGEHVQLRTSMQGGLRSVHADASQMHQVVLNLCLNARDAMPEGGTLRLETQNRTLAEEDCMDRSDTTPGHYVLLTVADDGDGIPESLRERIFEPFFTTKEVGQGTGLGLATVYAIIKGHQGFIEFDSTPGEGTEFRVFLPASEGTPDPQRTAAERKPDRRGDGQVVLLAEDDPAVSGLIARCLQDMGYEVLSAADGEQAARIVKEQGQRLDIAVLDVVMPGRGGKYVYDLLRRRDLYIPVLFSSGYSRNALGEDGMPAGAELIQKPYTPDQLLRRIHDLLAST